MGNVRWGKGEKQLEIGVWDGGGVLETVLGALVLKCVTVLDVAVVDIKHLFGGKALKCWQAG